ncbi:hypothetical protein HKX69_05895 [Streptomyces argyrophyllae]|uniref:DUF2188 domain-containing protein n=1 Tax=Streptomyces argyrophylli TaxID=2726118 RepID=A0A6M4PHG8_9ACTN|nr:hypothetical protein [Streptomyces argyrophyllae]QJS09106.1 hypothetical protein HKX69_05895 [Streptomyces argyrophyllae]
MKNFKVEWDQDGQRVRSVVSYSERAAQTRKKELEAEGRTNVTVLEVPISGGKR